MRKSPRRDLDLLVAASAGPAVNNNERHAAIHRFPGKVSDPAIAASTRGNGTSQNDPKLRAAMSLDRGVRSYAFNDLILSRRYGLGSLLWFVNVVTNGGSRFCSPVCDKHHSAVAT